MDLGALARLFTADCEVIYGPDPQLTRTGCRCAGSLACPHVADGGARHTTFRTSAYGLDGTDHVLSESYVMAWHERTRRHHGTVFGRYLDRLTRTPDGWRIAQRRMEMNGADAAFRVAIPQAQRHPPPPGWVPPPGLDGPRTGRTRHA